MTGYRLRVRVTPRGGTDRIDGIQSDESGHRVLRLRVRAAPADGEANTAVIVVLAKALKLPKSRLELVAGATARNKTIWIGDLDETEVWSRLIA
ncbi:MAG: DUF167 domain-containing protein [Caulobacterales bacterium]|nr:DUF167 domain-containing protein [Caulobacterales bacterium]